MTSLTLRVHGDSADPAITHIDTDITEDRVIVIGMTRDNNGADLADLRRCDRGRDILIFFQRIQNGAPRTICYRAVVVDHAGYRGRRNAALLGDKANRYLFSLRHNGSPFRGDQDSLKQYIICFVKLHPFYQKM